MPLEIPIDAKNPESEQVTSLDGTAFVIGVSWSERGESWYLNVSLQRDGQDPAPVLLGARVSVGYPPLLGVVGERPLGEIVPMDVSDQTGYGADPGRYDLGTRVRLMYYTAEELGRAAP